MKVWLDGFCNTCGCIVIETGATGIGADYQNSCTNPQCINYGWHYNFDDEFQKYYRHGYKDEIDNK